MRYISILFFLICAACATAPSEEFKAYRASFDAANTQTEALLDVYNDIEKSIDATSRDRTTLDPNRAYLFVPAADAPRTRLLREGFKLVADYNVLLGRYVEGGSLTSIQPEIDRVKASAVTIGSSVGAITGTVGIGTVAPGLIDGAQALAQLALFNDDVERFRASVVANQPVVDGFLAQARAQAEAMYSEARTYRRDRILAGAGAAKTEMELEAFKVATASWVLVIDETRRNLAFLTEAVKQDQRGTSFPQVAESTERIASFAEQMQSAQQIFGKIF